MISQAIFTYIQFIIIYISVFEAYTQHTHTHTIRLTSSMFNAQAFASLVFQLETMVTFTHGPKTKEPQSTYATCTHIIHCIIQVYLFGNHSTIKEDFVFISWIVNVLPYYHRKSWHSTYVIIVRFIE